MYQKCLCFKLNIAVSSTCQCQFVVPALRQIHQIAKGITKQSYSKTDKVCHLDQFLMYNHCLYKVLLMILYPLIHVCNSFVLFFHCIKKKWIASSCSSILFYQLGSYVIKENSLFALLCHLFSIMSVCKQAPGWNAPHWVENVYTVMSTCIFLWASLNLMTRVIINLESTLESP